MLVIGLGFYYFKTKIQGVILKFDLMAITRSLWQAYICMR